MLQRPVVAEADSRDPNAVSPDTTFSTQAFAFRSPADGIAAFAPGTKITRNPMAPLLLRRWRIVRVPRLGRLDLHASTPAVALLAVIFTGQAESILLWVGIWAAALVHAGGHVVAANLVGELPESVTLYPFWSTTRLFRSPMSIPADLKLTVAGPMANAALGAAMLLAYDGPLGREPDWLGQWARIQIGMGAVSLLPLFPLDGARILRLTLKLRYAEEQSFRIAGFVNQAAAAGVFFWALVQGFYGIAVAGIALYLLGRFSTFLLVVGMKVAEASRLEEEGLEPEVDEDGRTITLTQTADGVWQQVGPSPNNEVRIYF